MRTSRVNLQRPFLQVLDRQRSRSLNWHNLIQLPMQDQNRNVNLLQILRVIILPGDRSIIDSFEAAQHALLIPTINQTLGRRRTGEIIAEERASWDIGEQLGTVGDHAGARSIEPGNIPSFGVVLFQEHARRRSADENGFGDSTRAVAAEESDYFCTAGRVAYERRVFEVQVLDEG